ncbi:unnamed protein product, partial [Phaeothamnion confervicola]
CNSLSFLNQPYQCDTTAWESCLDSGTNPDGGILSFDNLLWSMLTLFCVTTLDGWGSTMMYTQHVMNEQTFWFFVTLILSGTYTIMNLIVATLLMKFNDLTVAKDLKGMRLAAQKRPRRRRQALKAAVARAAAELAKTADAAAGGGATGNNRQIGAKAGATAAKAAAEFEDGGGDEKGGLPHLALRIKAADEGGGDGKGPARPVSRWRGLLQAIMGGTRNRTMRAMLVSEQSPFSKFIHFCIIVNVAMMAMDGYAISSELEHVLAIGNTVLTALFVAEMCLKMTVLGLRHYWSRPFNIFDAFISVASLVEVCASSAAGSLGSMRTVRMFRLFRLMRVGRLAEAAKSIVGVVFKSAADMWPILALLLLVMFIFSVLGMQLFGTHLTPSSDAYSTMPQARQVRFDTFFWSFIQVFTVITGNNWVDLMYTSMSFTSPVASLFFIVLIVIGQWMMLNLVLAVVLEGASDQMKEKYVAQRFRDKIMKLFHRQHMRLAIRRW